MNKFILPIAFCMSVAQVYGQSDNKGKILNQNQEPLAFVDLIFLKDNLSIFETSTNEKGEFESNLASGNYQLIIEESGIEISSQQITIQNNKPIGIILVKTKTVDLKEAVVLGQKKLIEKKVDRLVFNADLAEGAKGGNALDVLKLTPRIKVDDNTDAVSIIGKGSVSVLINDRLVQMSPDQLSNYLKSIKAEDIDKIEVITNPPAKYDAVGNSGVLNIVLKSAKNDSFNGSLSTSYGYQLYENYNYNASFNYRKDKWTITSNLYQGNGRYGSPNNSEIYYSDSTWKTKTENNYKNRYGGARVGVDYDISETLITGFNFNYGLGDGNENNQSRTKIFNYQEDRYVKYIDTDNNGSKWNWNNLGLNYHIIKKFKQEGKKLTFDFDFSNNNNDQKALFYSNEFDANLIPIENREETNQTNTNMSTNRYSFSLDMEHPINSWKMNYGGRIRLGKDISDNNRYLKSTDGFQPDLDFAHKYQYNENIYALYYSVEKALTDKWTAKVGLRYEKADVKGISKAQNLELKRTYDGLFPTAYLAYELTENNTFSINYSRRVERPRLWMLNPALIKENDYRYSTGNPDILPAYSNNFEFEYAYKDLSITSIYYRSEKDILEQVAVVDPETKIVTSKPYNIGNTYSYGLSENVNLKISKWWKINASANLFYTKTKGKIPQLNYVLDGFNGEFRLTNDFFLNKKKTFVANYTYSYDTKSYLTIDVFSPVTRHNVGVRAKVFDDKLQLSLNIYNLFKNNDSRITSRSNDIITTGLNQSFRTLRFGVTYNFGKSFKVEQSKSNLEITNGNK